MIAIKTKEHKQFPPASVGYIQMEIDLVQNIPGQKLYVLRIKDTCYIDNEQGKQQLNQPLTRFFTLTYDEINQLASSLDMTDITNLADNINELFRQGLLLITQQECMEGIGRYFTQAADWEIVKEDN